jgi:hypothetical protein
VRRWRTSVGEVDSDFVRGNGCSVYCAVAARTGIVTCRRLLSVGVPGLRGRSGAELDGAGQGRLGAAQRQIFINLAVVEFDDVIGHMEVAIVVTDDEDGLSSGLEFG